MGYGETSRHGGQSQDKRSKFKKEPAKLTWEEELKQHLGDDDYLRMNCGVNTLDARNILRIYADRRDNRGQNARR